VVDVPVSPDGAPVVVLQALVPSVGPDTDSALVALLATVRAYREFGAGPITVFVPHLAYARQDRHVGGELRPITARLLAELLATAGADSVCAPASGAASRLTRLFAPMDLTLLSPDGFMQAALEAVPRDAVLVAPDQGSGDLVSRIAAATERSFLVLDKVRTGPSDVVVSGVRPGQRRLPRRAVVVDDLICSAGTVEAASRALAAKGVESVYALATHLRLTPVGHARLVLLRREGLLTSVQTTDSVPAKDLLPFVRRTAFIDAFCTPLADTLDASWGGCTKLAGTTSR